MIYSKEDQLIDCEYVRKKSYVNEFLQTFYNEVNMARLRNFTAPPNNADMHRQQTDQLDGNYMRYNPDTDADAMVDAFGLRSLEYTNVQDENDVPADMLPLMNYHSLKMQCDERHRQMKKIVHGMNSEEPESRRAATEHLERYKKRII